MMGWRTATSSVRLGRFQCPTVLVNGASCLFHYDRDTQEEDIICDALRVFFSSSPLQIRRSVAATSTVVVVAVVFFFFFFLRVKEETEKKRSGTAQ
ncbi:hypothetical protein F2P81_004275 [Scophthalmus maximus]|uniref:Uncharacterized protein n=1 Tax=Scophthalmus maximus TaxID=52904 RepID=A0A6A4TET2_SCOMX|nr:hypothetical protein F2P81_004275 [Scophthalmus maximus]